jgi:hypothetical protein
VLRSLLNLGNEHVLKPFDLKIVRRSRVLAIGPDPDVGIVTKRIAFFHPPKCGGTSVNKWLCAAFGGPAGLDPVAAEAAARNLHISSVELREVMLAYFVQRSRARFISGHFNYSSRAFEGHEDEFELVTILRNPLDRLLSNYYFNRFLEDRVHFPIEVDLADWLETDQARAMARVFTKMFVGDTEEAAAVNETGECRDMPAAIAKAMHNLEKFKIVGTLERLKDFEAEIRQRYGVKSRIEHLRKSPRPGYLKFSDQPSSIQERLLELCQPDMLIYERFARKAPQARPTLQPIANMAGLATCLLMGSAGFDMIAPLVIDVL